VVIESIRCGDVAVQLARPEAADLVVLLEAAVEEAPYWAELWPSARALADAVAAREVHGLSVLEVGCGLGLPALVAAARGADVTASDVDTGALDCVLASASISCSPPTCCTSTRRLRTWPPHSLSCSLPTDAHC
jgi:hypothetical protein